MKITRFIHIGMLFFLLGCATGRGINKDQLNMYSYAAEKEIGRQYSVMVSRQFAPLYDAEVNAYVDKIGQKMVNVATDPLFDYQFRVFKTDMVNAFTVGAGYVYFTVGIINAAPSESALASVVGHEIGHVLSRHVTERLTKANLIGLAASLAGTGAGDAINLFGNIGLLQFGKQNELESDGLGLQLLHRSNYNLNGGVEMFKVLKKLSENQASIPLLSDLLSTHPKPQDRINRLNALIPTYKKRKAQIVTDTQTFRNIKNKIQRYIHKKKSFPFG